MGSLTIFLNDVRILYGVVCLKTYLPSALDDFLYAYCLYVSFRGFLDVQTKSSFTYMSNVGCGAVGDRKVG